MTKLETIRKACIKANESILDLKFGCFIEDKQMGSGVIVKTKGDTYTVHFKDYVGGCDFTYTKGKEDRNFGKIIGRPITLPDVLLAIESIGKSIELMSNGNIRDFACHTGTKRIENWNLKENLDWHAKNSPKTIDLIYNLIQ